MIKTLLFDADGTLLDYPLSERQALGKALEGFDYQGDFESVLGIYKDINIQLWKSYEEGGITQEELRTRRFAALRDQIKLTPEDNSSFEKIEAAALSAKYLRALGQTGFLITDGLETVQKLHAVGRYKLAIVTNGLKDVQYDRLKAAGLHDFFDNIIISEEIGVQKPRKEFFEKSFQLIGNENPEEYMIIGDTYSSDIQGGGERRDKNLLV